MKQLLFIATLFTYLLSMSQTTEKMIIEKLDGTKNEICVDDIRRVVFESVFSNPAGSIANPIDLGLSVKWASWNLGASSYKDIGGYYGWGDVTGNLTSDNLLQYPSATPPSNIAGTAYDVAKAKWGGYWRLPTSEEVKQMVDACEWSYYEEDGQLYITGRAQNGNSLVFPVAGYRIGSEICKVNVLGWYWSGSLTIEDTDYADILAIDMEDKSVGRSAVVRFLGLNVRPVFDDSPKLKIATVRAENITSDSATLVGSFEGDDTNGMEIGFFYTLSGNPSAENGTKISVIPGSSSEFKGTVKGLSSKSTYKFCAYAYMNGGYTYGDVIEFSTTEKTTGTVAGYEWVDLGLPSGLKWATCNVGASKPNEHGSFYAWGCTSPSSNWSAWNYYRHWNGSSVNNIGSEISGNVNYDAARYHWGSTWRLPTLAEMEELVNYCTAECCYLDGVPVTKVTGPNGNYIYFVYPGSDYGHGLTGRNSYGYYWSGTSSTNFHAPYLFFQKDSGIHNFRVKNNTSNNAAGNTKYGAGAVRPVTE